MRPAVNNGYFPNFTNEQLGTLAAQAGAKAMRIGMTEEIAELFGYDILRNLFEHYKQEGMDEHTVILSGPIDWHRDTAFHCPQARSALFRNLYTPIWDGGANGTPYNENNYFAAYVYKMVSLYRPYVRYWEVWNEPGFDVTGARGWLPPNQPGNWWANGPAPCDYILHAPIQHYVRTLRIAWEVVKTLQPEGRVLCSGVGYASFVSALMRYTDNPDGGKRTAAYPHDATAYFDAFGFHSYPHFDGSVRFWDNSCQCMRNTRHSDGAVQGTQRTFVGYYDSLRVAYQRGGGSGSLLNKIWNLSEGNVPAKSFLFGADTLLGGVEMQRNFTIKNLVQLAKNNVNQYGYFQIFNRKTLAAATEPFEVMGLYEVPAALGTSPPITQAGIAYATTSQHLHQMVTDSVTYPAGVGGGSFWAIKNLPNGGQQRVRLWVLWAQTQQDKSELANITYTFPAGTFSPNMVVRQWNFSQTGAFTPLTTPTLQLTGTPVFIVDDPTWGVPVADTRPAVNLTLQMTGGPTAGAAAPSQTVRLTVKNNSNIAATGIRIGQFLDFSKPFLLDRMRYERHEAPAGTSYQPLTGEWSIPTLGAGQSMTLTIVVLPLHTGPLRIFAQVEKADQPDPTSKPLNGQVNKVPYEDDEASHIVQDNGLMEIRPDLVVESMRFPPNVRTSQPFELTFMVRNNSRVDAAAATQTVLYLSRDSLWSADDVALLTLPTEALPAYAYANRQRFIQLPANTITGKYYLLFRADAGQMVDEYDESNVFARPIRVDGISATWQTQYAADSSMRVNPNPAHEEVSIVVAGVPEAVFPVLLYNAWGQLVCQTKLRFTSHVPSHWEVGALPAGLYQLVIPNVGAQTIVFW